MGNPLVLVFTLKVLLPRNPSLLVLALKVPQSLRPGQAWTVGQSASLRKQVLDQKEHRLDGHSMNPKSAMTVKKDHVKKIFIGGLSPKAAEERIGSTLANFRR